MTEYVVLFVLALVEAALIGSAGWLVKKVVSHEKTLGEHGIQVHGLMNDMQQVKREALTQECVRRVVKEALSERDQLWMLQTKDVARDAAEEALRRTMRRRRVDGEDDA